METYKKIDFINYFVDCKGWSEEEATEADISELMSILEEDGEQYDFAEYTQ